MWSVDMCAMLRVSKANSVFVVVFLLRASDALKHVFYELHV